jgi:hypothetical protein
VLKVLSLPFVRFCYWILKMFRHYHWVDTSAGGLLVAEYITRGVFNIVAARLSYVEKSHCTES